MSMRIAAAALLAWAGLASPALADGDPAKGLPLVRQHCSHCHGLDGNARSTSFQPIPMLAGQPAVYLLRQMQNFAAGKREDTSKSQWMTRVLSLLTEEDMADLAAYYEAQGRY